MDALNQVAMALGELVAQLATSPLHFTVALMPMLVFLELPYYLLLLSGVMRFALRRARRAPLTLPYYPRVSCLITCYAEGEAVTQTLHTLCEQTYPGEIEIIPIIDGALQNDTTYRAVQRFIRGTGRAYPRHRIVLLPKWQRGGRVSSLNAGLSICRGEVVMALDGDTSFDNDMVQQMVRHFVDPRVCAVSGALKVRNAGESLVTRLQEVEYRLSLLLARIGLAEFNVINNVSGAFGAFRRSALVTVGGWNTGTAEDLDITLRLKHYFARNGLRIAFEPLAVGHTDVPPTLRQFLLQRLRWDGDLSYIYLRKHWHSFRPGLIGWPNLILLVWSGLLFQLVAPFVITAYLGWLAFTMPAAAYLALNLLVFAYYLGISLLLYGSYLLVGSRTPWRDALDLPLLLPFAFFVFLTRLWSVVAILNEMLRRGHEETSMAPWWVLKRTHRH